MDTTKTASQPHVKAWRVRTPRLAATRARLRDDTTDGKSALQRHEAQADALAKDDIEEIDGDVDLVCRTRLIRMYHKARHLLDDPTDALLLVEVLDNLLLFCDFPSPFTFPSAPKPLRTNLHTSSSVIATGLLSEADYGLMCESMRFDRAWPHALLSIRRVRSAICEAAQPTGSIREGAHISVLGGKVWRNPLRRSLSPSGWDLLYRLVSSILSTFAMSTYRCAARQIPCGDCVVRETYTFADWARFTNFSIEEGRYPEWQLGHTAPIEVIFRRYGGILSNFPSPRAA